ncbi:MAG: chitobiase/beta-hexosaminidase C-terminal domain-containing protein, partial [Desulfobacteraceae bacterium]|nr:chitobiase/beta-hexosaminidase C-terminal domain-containing protein [Desulfobacteraceae bacterium]
QAREMTEQCEESFIQALQGTYNRLFYPNEDGLQAATIENGLKFGSEAEDTAEKQIEAMLASMRCDHKLAMDAQEDPTPYFSMAENDLWPQSDRRTPWRDMLMRAKSNPAWPWMPGSRGLEKLKDMAVSQGRWREGVDGYIEKGPFPKNKTQINVAEQSMDERAEEIILSLNPKNAGPAPKVHYSTTPDVSESDAVADELEAFRTNLPTLYFLTIDTTGEHETGDPTRWVARIKLRHQVHDYADHRELELQAVPSAEIRYTTDGTNPREGRIYEGPVTVGDEKILLQVYAKAGEAKGQSSFTIPEKGRQRAEIDDTKPARLVNQKVRLDTTDKVFTLISTFKGRSGVSFQGVT